jgi:hypothetical protein
VNGPQLISANGLFFVAVHCLRKLLHFEYGFRDVALLDRSAHSSPGAIRNRCDGAWAGFALDLGQPFRGCGKMGCVALALYPFDLLPCVGRGALDGERWEPQLLQLRPPGVHRVHVTV